MDYRSICRHAGGIFLSKDHRRIALVVPNSGVAGDIASEAGFCEAIAQHKQDETFATALLPGLTISAAEIFKR